MPPFGFRKRERSPSPPPKNSKTPPSKKAKPTLFETADTPRGKQKTVEENKKYLEGLDGDDDDSSLSESENEEFEDVPPSKRLKTTARKAAATEEEDDDDQDDDDDEMEWEDAILSGPSSHAGPSKSNVEPDITDISISMKDDGTYITPLVSAATGKKAPSRLERQVRYTMHCIHVQTLMWHNTIRNSWLNDAEVQKVLLDGLTEGVQREVQRCKDAMAMPNATSSVPKSGSTPKGKGKQAQKGKKKSTGRDWNEAAATSELDVRGGDPLPRLLKVLTAYWRKRFTVTAPGLRKQGYQDQRTLGRKVKGWVEDRNNFEEYGERVENLAAFRKLAKKCEGSRDVGAQLFVALLRGLGLETRMVASLQPAGFGWSKAEDADLKKTAKKAEKVAEPDTESDDEKPVKRKRQNSKPAPKKTAKKKSKAVVEDDTEPEDERPAKRARRSSKPAPKKAKEPLKAEKPSRKSARGNKSDPIDLDESDSPLSDAPYEPEDPAVDNDDDEDDISIIDITPPSPKKKPTKKYDRDMAYPNYWTEVCSPLSHKYYPVDPIVLSTIASNDELLQTFEPRGKKAEKAKQVMCYTVAFSSDGTAKDVTVRYLKRHQLPGKTKGVRMGITKMPIYNWKGKVRGYQEYDWFGTLMLRHTRPHHKRTVADDLEEQTDLKPYQASKQEKKVTKESLQGYKQSAEFVLEQHLRREEALLPGAEPVKYFTSGKGDKAQELPVYSRDDVAACKTVESWHKEGRAVKVGEQPLKYVPVRAVTLVRKREVEDVQRETGEKMKQGLYSEAQTEWIIPPPIQNGVIPKNAFGNMDVYVPTMVPKGAIHLPLRGSAKLCRKLEIDYAEACTGFEFGNKRAVPILTGVVVAEEHAGMVRDAWRADQKELKRKEDTKRTATSLHWWRKMLLGLRVLERMRTEYADNGGNDEDMNPFIRKARANGSAGGSKVVDLTTDDDNAGGYSTTHQDDDTDQGQGGGFLLDDENDVDMEGGGFLIEEDGDVEVPKVKKNHAPITPVSLQSMHKTLNGATDSELDTMETSDTSRGKALPTKTRKKNTAAKNTTTDTRKGKAVAKGKSARKYSAASADLDSMSLSDLSEPDTNESEVDIESEDSDDDVPTTKKGKSPKVVVNSNRRSLARSAKKSTPVRSQYFEHSDDSGDAATGESESEDEVEVVKPRMTTARTKGR